MTDLFGAFGLIDGGLADVRGERQAVFVGGRGEEGLLFVADVDADDVASGILDARSASAHGHVLESIGNTLDESISALDTVNNWSIFESMQITPEKAAGSRLLELVNSRELTPARIENAERSPHRAWCVKHNHPGSIYNPIHDLTVCACAEMWVAGDGAAQALERPPAPIRFCIDEDCPNCGWPERWLDHALGCFGCNKCDYTSTERSS